MELQPARSTIAHALCPHGNSAHLVIECRCDWGLLQVVSRVTGPSCDWNSRQFAYLVTDITLIMFRQSSMYVYSWTGMVTLGMSYTSKGHGHPGATLVVSPMLLFQPGHRLSL